jgi:hypothetical protein
MSQELVGCPTCCPQMFSSLRYNSARTAEIVMDSHNLLKKVAGSGSFLGNASIYSKRGRLEARLKCRSVPISDVRFSPDLLG